MGLQHVGGIDLPAHTGSGGFDHAAVHQRTGRVYVAHTANNAVDVIDRGAHRYVKSIPDLTAVAGTLVSDDDDLVFSSNRGEDTVGIWTPGDDSTVAKVAVGNRPNGLAYDARRRRLLAANVGDPARSGSFSVSVVDIGTQTLIGDLPLPGRPRWTVFDPAAEEFHVNIASPPAITVIDATGDRIRLRRSVVIPSAGPHGLDLDGQSRHLFCACDDGRLVVVHADSGEVLSSLAISGEPDVVFFNAGLRRLYVAIGTPGVIEVWDTDPMRRRETLPTERGAHTLAFDAATNTVYAFLPDTHRAAVYVDA